MKGNTIKTNQKSVENYPTHHWYDLSYFAYFILIWTTHTQKKKTNTQFPSHIFSPNVNREKKLREKWFLFRIDLPTMKSFSDSKSGWIWMRVFHFYFVEFCCCCCFGSFSIWNIYVFQFGFCLPLCKLSFNLFQRVCFFISVWSFSFGICEPYEDGLLISVK